MAKYIANMVVRRGEISKLQLIKTTKNNTRDMLARRVNHALFRVQRSNPYAPYFAIACGNCWHIYEAVEKSDHPKLRLTKLPQAAAEMWLRHRSAP